MLGSWHLGYSGALDCQRRSGEELMVIDSKIWMHWIPLDLFGLEEETGR